MQTLGQAVEAFLIQSEERGLTKGPRAELAGVLHKQLLWDVFCLLPQCDYPLDYQPIKAKLGRTTETLDGYQIHWTRFFTFLQSSNVHFFTMGDAVQSFLSTMTDDGFAPQTVAMARSCVKLLGREYASNLLLSAIEGRIITTIKEQASQRRPHSRRPIFRLLRYLQEQGYVQHPVFQRTLPKWKREMDAMIRNSAQNVGPDSLFSDCLGQYFSHCMNAKNMTEVGLKAQYHKLSFFSQWLGNAPLSTVDLDRVEHYLIYLQEERNNGLAALKSAAVALKSLFVFLTEDGILPENPLVQLRIKQPFLESRSVLTKDEVTRLLQATRQLSRETSSGSTQRIQAFMAARDIAIIELLIQTGIRSSELRGLVLSNLNLQRGHLDISGKGSNRYYKKERRVYLESEQTKKALDDYLASRPAEFGPLLFVTKNGNPLKAGDLGDIVTRCVQAAGISKHVTPHDLRATFASILCANGADPLTLKALMGHESLQVTLKLYVSLEQEQLHEVWQKSNPLAHLPPRRGGPLE
jgi:integrase/recombinase XerD